MNLSAISNKSLIGRMLRKPLTLIPDGTVIPIMQGKLRGKRWIVGAGNHGQWLGSYEYEKQELFTSTIRPKMNIYDIGANVGFYTLLASELVGPSGNVIAFEPLPRNIAYLKNILSINNAANVQLIEAAVSGCEGKATFKQGKTDFEGSLVEDGAVGDLEVETVSIDYLVATAKIPSPDCIKIDVEGAEVNVLKGAAKTLIRYRPIVFLATHSESLHLQCCRMLEEFEYRLNPIGKLGLHDTDEIFAEPRY